MRILSIESTGILRDKQTDAHADGQIGRLADWQTHRKADAQDDWQ